MTKPTTLFFDINETLLDLTPMKDAVGAALGGRDDLLPLWFTSMLHYSLVDTITDNYRPFGEVGVAVLMMLAEKHGVEMSRSQATEAIMDQFLSLPPHPDVRAALETFSDEGFKIVALANSSAAAIKAQFDFAKLTGFFDMQISTEEVGAFKPDARTYQHGLIRTGAKPEEVVMIAAHAWDLAGAKKAGLTTAFVAREGQTLYPNVSRPDFVADDLHELSRLLIT